MENRTAHEELDPVVAAAMQGDLDELTAHLQLLRVPSDLLQHADSVVRRRALSCLVECMNHGTMRRARRVMRRLETQERPRQLC